MKRRHFLQGLGAAGLTIFTPRFGRAAENEVCVSIFHTTDLHGHIVPTISYTGEKDLGGLARCAAQIRAWRGENANHLVLDVGDVYQGTEEGLRTRGTVMIDCLNTLGYDGWVVGNHEFDWGIDPFLAALEQSRMPILTANALLEGRPAGTLDPARSPLGKIQPFLIKEVAGFRIGVAGLTTPGIPFWFQPSFFAGFAPRDPVESARETIAEMKRQKVDAIVLAVHMGTRTQGDDFANHMDALTRAFPEVAVVLAGHTHRDLPNERVNGVLYTQANYYGLNAGRVDLYFDADSRKLARTEAKTVKMGRGLPLDPVVMSLAQSVVDDSAAALAVPAGELKDTLSAKSSPGAPSEIERLIAAACVEGLAKRGVKVDGVLHGLFGDADFPAGPKTVGDFWTVIPYENYLMTGELTGEDLKAVMNEVVASSRSDRSLTGFRVEVERADRGHRVKSLTDRDGKPLSSTRRYLIAMNTFDASSGGQRLMRLREIMQSSDARPTIHPVQTREALIGFFAERASKGVSRAEFEPV